MFASNSMSAPKFCATSNDCPSANCVPAPKVLVPTNVLAPAVKFAVPPNSRACPKFVLTPKSIPALSKL